MSALSATMRALEAIVGEEHLLTDTAAVSTYAVDGQVPAAVAFAGSPEEVAALLRTAAEAGLSVLLRGGGHHLYLGAPAGPVGVVVCLTRLNQIVEYDPGDLTITAQAGMSLAALQEVVGRHGQMVPFDPPGPDTTTLGGLVGANLSGPMRMRYGTARDLVLGVRAALASGEIIKAGGKTVKNVAGYDLTKLFVGSLGTIGAVVEVTLRLVPMPERRAVMLTAVPQEQALEIAARVAASPWELSACEVINHVGAQRLRAYLPAVDRRDSYLVCLGLGGSGETVRRQETEIRSVMGEGWARFDELDTDGVWQRVRGLTYPSAAKAVLVRANVLPSAVGEVLRLASPLSGWSAVAHVGDGVVHLSFGEDNDNTVIKRTLALVRRACEEAGGYAALESGPVELKREFGVWGSGMQNVELMQALRRAYDPAGALGCGRLV